MAWCGWHAHNINPHLIVSLCHAQGLREPEPRLSRAVAPVTVGCSKRRHCAATRRELKPRFFGANPFLQDISWDLGREGRGKRGLAAYASDALDPRHFGKTSGRRVVEEEGYKEGETGTTGNGEGRVQCKSTGTPSLRLLCPLTACALLTPLHFDTPPLLRTCRS